MLPPEMQPTKEELKLTKMPLTTKPVNQPILPKQVLKIRQKAKPNSAHQSLKACAENL